ncbi:hypothetical protein FSST1_010033 [Fusarium sambucinum]
MAGHKLTPALMAGSLLLGLLLALGHHFYYLYLDGRIVESQSQQQWFLRAGTGLAFLVRAFLSAAVGIAYTQILWRTLRSKPITIRGVNSLFGVVHNVWDFVTWELWTAAPLLAVIAIISWALPLVAVITPATLTVEVSTQPNITVLDAPLPIPDYDTRNSFGEYSSMGQGILIPSNYMSRLFLSVVSQGSILAPPAPFPNSSYALEFYGPELSCNTPKNASFLNQTAKMIQDNNFYSTTLFVAFVPTYVYDGGINILPVEDCALQGLNDTLNTTAPKYIDETTSKRASRLYVIRPHRTYPPTEMEAIECKLHNSSIALNFTFANGQHNVMYKSKKLNPVSHVGKAHCYNEDRRSCNAALAYGSILSAMGQFLVGYVGTGKYGDLYSVSTQIRSSVLMDTKEMQAANSGTPESMIGNISLSNALEDIFRNATISMFSNSNFLQNNTAASRGPVTYSSPQNEFSYEPRNLFIAYGIGLLLSFAIVLVGLLCIKSASASYESRFSTIVRTTRNPELDTVVPAAETTGVEPLSKYLSNVRLVLRRQGGGPQSSNGEEVTFFAVDSKSDDMKMEKKNSPAESLLQRDEATTRTDTSVKGPTVHNESSWERDEGRNLDVSDRESPWERNAGRNLEMYNHREDARRD